MGTIQHSKIYDHAHYFIMSGRNQPLFNAMSISTATNYSFQKLAMQYGLLHKRNNAKNFHDSGILHFVKKKKTFL